MLFTDADPAKSPDQIRAHVRLWRFFGDGFWDWDEEKKRWRTKNETFETKTIFRSNRKEIEEWIKQFKTVFGLEKNEEDTDTRVVAVDVDRVHVRNMEIALDRHQIRYEIDG